MKEAVETMGENLYHRFIDAFKDENETDGNQKRSPLISDEQLEDTLKVVQQSIKKKINRLKPNKEQEEREQQEQETQKSSRFQRWIVHYLTAPFRKWEKKSEQQMNVQKQSNEEENRQLDSSSDTDDDEEQISIPERIKQRLEKLKKKVCLITFEQ